MTIDNGRALLYLRIHSGEGIDTPSLHLSVGERHYFVVAGVDEDEEICTRIVWGLPDPKWEEIHELLLEDYPQNHGFLYVKVLRFDAFKNDPGTSSGFVLVGRTRIPLPKKFDIEKHGRFGLLTDAGERNKGEGHIVVSMRMERI